MRILLLFLAMLLQSGLTPAGETFLRQLQPRDSILVADQLEYGFVLENVAPGSQIGLPDMGAISSDTLFLVRDWKIDTLRVKGRARKGDGPLNVSASVVLAPFEAGTYHLPDIPVGLMDSDGKVDTLLFSASTMEVRTMPVDTSTFVIHDLKGQIRYPLTFRETIPYVLAVLAAAALVFLVVWLIRRRKASTLSRKEGDPAYIVALRNLDRYRGDKFWTPEKQKAFYSGITDTLKEYVDARFAIDAPEMTTAELFEALRSCSEVSADLYVDAKSLFETADLVKFAKMTVPEADLAKALPTAVRFVTDTIRKEIEKEVGA